MSKTLKAVTERLRVTKRHKLLRRTSQQGHFKAKESGKERRLKRKLLRINQHSEFRKAIRKYVPHLKKVR